MTDESAAPGAPQEPVEARFVRTSWLGLTLTILAFVFFAVLGANWLPREFPGGPPWMVPAWALTWVAFAVWEIIQWARGKRGRFRCSRCNTPVKLVSAGVGRMRPASSCEVCRTRLTFPPAD